MTNENSFDLSDDICGRAFSIHKATKLDNKPFFFKIDNGLGTANEINSTIPLQFYADFVDRKMHFFFH